MLGVQDQYREEENMGEPVAWRWRWNDYPGDWLVSADDPRTDASETRLARLGEVYPLFAHPAPVIPASPAVGDDDLIEQWNEWARDIDNDGTASQVGPTADECRKAASRLAALQASVLHYESETAFMDERIVALQQRVEELEAQSNKDAERIFLAEGNRDDWRERAEAAEAREKALQDALEPFAKIADEHDSGKWIWGISSPSLTDARRARAVLSQETGKP